MKRRMSLSINPESLTPDAPWIASDNATAQPEAEGTVPKPPEEKPRLPQSVHVVVLAPPAAISVSLNSERDLPESCDSSIQPESCDSSIQPMGSTRLVLGYTM